jgi:hypothetical protein
MNRAKLIHSLFARISWVIRRHNASLTASACGEGLGKLAKKALKEDGWDGFTSRMINEYDKINNTL